MKMKVYSLSLAVGLGAAAWAAEAPRTPANSNQGADKQKQEAALKLEAKVGEMSALSNLATEITKRIGDLASSGKLPNSNDAIELMKKLVDEMSLIRQKMEQVEAEVAEIKSWMAGHKDATTQDFGKDIDLLKKTRPFGFIQTQYRDTNLKGGANDAFSIRRMRVGFNHQADPKTSLKVSWDLATGANQQSAILKDAFVAYDIDPTHESVDLQLTAGQHAIPLGYQLTRSDTENEWPERAVYNQKLFNGERSQGVSLKYGLGDGMTFHLGGWNALSTSDAEQSSLPPGGESRLAMSAALRKKGTNYDVGVSAFRGDRPKFTSGSGSSAIVHPRVDREFVYVDTAYTGLFSPKITLRGEAMWGKDRVPVTGTPATASGQKDMAGFHVQAGYTIDAKNALHIKFEQFDPDTDSPNNALIGYGAVWSHYLSSNLKLSAAHEIFDDAARSGPGVRQQRYHITTLRVQLKF